MAWTMTNRDNRPVPPRTDRYYNIMGPGGKIRAAYPELGSDANGPFVRCWDTNTGSKGIMWPGDVIAFSEPIELSENVVAAITPTCRQGTTFRCYCESQNGGPA